MDNNDSNDTCCWAIIKVTFLVKPLRLAYVPIYGWRNFKIFCAVGKKIQLEALGGRVEKKSAVKSICRPDVSIIFRRLNSCFDALYA